MIVNTDHHIAVYSDVSHRIIERRLYADVFAEFWAYKVQSPNFLWSKPLEFSITHYISSARFAKLKSWISSPKPRGKYLPYPVLTARW